MRIATRVVLLLMAGVLPVFTATGAEKPYELVVGNEVWQAGRAARNGTDWLALQCERAGCRFEPARVSVKPATWKRHYEDKPTRGQRLTFSLTKPVPGRTIAWFRVSPKHPPLTVGPVSTYASSAAPFDRPASEGTLEIAVNLPDGTQALFVPMLDRDAATFRLQLRARGDRQLLGELGQCSHEVSRDYLLWAGELDGDGKPDFLVSFKDADGEAVLFLSGAGGTRGEPLVGVGGTYVYPPADVECDGEGWLPR